MVGWVVSMLGSIVPLENMHLVITMFMKQGWSGLIKVILTFLIYLQDKIL